MYHRVRPLLILLSLILLPASNNSSLIQAKQTSFQTLFQDDFSNGLGKWTVTQGTWNIANGELVATAEKEPGMISAGDSSWSDYILIVKARSVGSDALALLLRWRDINNYYRVVLGKDHMEFWLRKSGVDYLLFRETSLSAPLYIHDYSIALSQSHEIKIKIHGAIPAIEAYIDGFPEITVKDLSGDQIPSGMIALSVDPGGSSAFDDVLVTTLHPDSSGPRHVIALLVEFSDLKHKYTPSQIYDYIFPALNRYYTEISYNQSWIIGTVAPEWRNLQKPWSGGQIAEFVGDAIKAWDKEVDYSKFDDVIVVGAGESCCASTYVGAEGIRVPTADGVTLTKAVFVGERDIELVGYSQFWKTIVHEVGHMTGLPDLYSYEIALTGPSPRRKAAIYVGPWDVMSRSAERPAMGAWDRIHLGWVPPDRVVELLPGQQGAATVEPLENPTEGIAAVIIYVNATTYFVVENRQPIGYDKVLPSKGILISYVDETKYSRGTGPVIVQDAHPEVGPRYDMPNATFDFGEGKRSEYTNATYHLAMALLDKFPNGSYVVAIAKQESIDIAKSAYAVINAANSAIQNASASTRAQGLDQAKILLQQAWQEFSKGDFEHAQDLAQKSQTAANSATNPSQTSEATTATSSTILIAQAITGLTIIGFIALIILRRRQSKKA